MRKYYFPIVITALVLFVSCSKSTPGTTPTPPGGGGGGGGSTTGMTVSSINPTRPYPDDEFTINGTGFNPDKTKDTVEFGHLTNGNFGAWHDGLSDEWASLCTVTSASATQLKIKAVNPFGLDAHSFSSFTNPAASIAVVQIRSGGKKVVTPLIPFKRLMLLNSTNDPETGITWGRPGDSLEILGRGFNKTGVSASINGVTLENFKVDSAAFSSKITMRLPKSFFGNSNDEAFTDVRTLSVTNADGKKLSKDVTFFMSPTMRIYSMTPSQSSYSKGSGGSILIYIVGRNLKGNAVVHVDSNTGTHSQAALAVGGFPDTYTLELTTPSMTVGNYQVSIWFGPNDALYGLCNFTVTN